MQDGAADRTIGGVYLWKPSAIIAERCGP